MEGRTGGSTLLSLTLGYIRMFGKQNLTEEGELDLWTKCFTIIQSLWWWSEPGNSPLEKGITQQKLKTSTDGQVVAQVNFFENWMAKTTRTAEVREDHATLLQERFLEAMKQQGADTDARLIQLAEKNTASTGSGEHSAQKWKQRFHYKTQTFILFASSEGPGTEKPEEPNDEYKQFIETPKSQATQLAAATILDTKEATQTIDNGMATMLFTGDFMNRNPDIHPRGISIFFAVPAKVMENEKSFDQINMLKDAGHLSIKEIEKLTTSQARIPEDESEFMQTLRNHVLLLAFVFGEKSWLCKSLITFKKQIKKIPRTFKTLCKNDKMFIPSVMARIDTKVQIFLNSCMKAKQTEDIAFKILSFDDEIDKFILQDQFQVAIPRSIRFLLNEDKKKTSEENNKGSAEKPTKRDVADQDEDKVPPSKKKKRDENKRNTEEAVKNTARVAEWSLKSGETYQVFNKNMHNMPKLNGKQVCATFHIKGYCQYGEKCNRKNTHKTLDEEASKKMTKWVEECRAGN
jgi:hypothetical protein